MSRWIGLLFIVLSIIACGSSTSDSSPAAAPTAIPASPTTVSNFILTTYPDTEATQSSTPAAPVTLTAKSALNVRSGPGTGYQILDTLKAGDSAQVVGQNGDWWDIQKGELAGWVTNDSSLVKIDGDTSQVAQVDAPPTAVFVSAPKPTPIPAQANNQAQSTNPPAKPQPTSAPAAASCPGFQYTCDQLTCAQAYACLKAGNRQLDGNNDGIPCNSKCK